MSSSGNAVSKGKILIIEDEAGFRRVYQDVIANDGFKVLVAEDGETGWQLAQSEKPNMIILDLALPKLHGFEVLRNIRADVTTKDIPVLIMTVFGEQEDIRKGFDLGATDYLVKGFYSPREILDKIHILLGQAEVGERKPVRYTLRQYRVAPQEGRMDLVKLQQDLGVTKFFRCSNCNAVMFLELIPDPARTDGYWFSAHFVCPDCGMSL